MVLPLVEQGDIYLSSSTKDSRKKLQILQNKALRCALVKENRFSTKELHKEAQLDPLKLRRRRHLLLHMYQFSKLKGFCNWKTKGRITTRNNSKKLMIVKKPNSTKYQKSITYLGPKTWNNMPKSLHEVENYATFKSKLCQI